MQKIFTNNFNNMAYDDTCYVLHVWPWCWLCLRLHIKHFQLCSEPCLNIISLCLAKPSAVVHRQPAWYCTSATTLYFHTVKKNQNANTQDKTTRVRWFQRAWSPKYTTMIIIISTDSSKVLSNFPSELKRTSAVQVGTLDITHKRTLINVCNSTSTQHTLMYLEMGFSCMTWMSWSCLQMTDCKMNVSASFLLSVKLVHSG